MASLPVFHKPKVSARDSMRARTNYTPKRYTGFAPVPLAAIAEIGRLSSGAACTQLLYVVLGLALGRPTAKDKPFHESTLPVHVSDLAELTACDERTIQRELIGLAQRRVVLMEKSGEKGEYVLTPLFRTWGALQDYKPGPVAEPELEASTEADEAEKPKEQTVTKLTAKPVAVRAGNSSRKIKVDCGVSEIYCKSNIDIHFEAVVQGGSLLVNLIGHQVDTRNQADGGPRNSRSSGISQLEESSRHGCRVEHPREAELGKLFDPCILQVSGKSLSADLICLQAACNAIGEVPHDWLVKAVIDRAARPISSPRAAVAICKEIAANWQKAKDLPAKKTVPSRAEIEAMIERDNAELARKRRRA